MSLTKEEILSNAATFKTREIEVPELGGTVFIRELSAVEYVRVMYLAGRLSMGMDERKTYAEMAAYFLSDENGKRLFGDNQVDQLGRLNALALEKIVKAGLVLNELADEKLQAAVERAEKN